MTSSDKQAEKLEAGQLSQLVDLIKSRNSVDEQISKLIGRPAEKGHIGEYLASKVFGIELHSSAAHKGSDGNFIGGPPALDGRTVNIKWYTKLEGLLDMSPAADLAYYLVLAGPREVASSSKGKNRPLVINAVFLFDAAILKNTLEKQGRHIGIATSVRQDLWNAAEIYPVQQNPMLILTDEQKRLLALFG